jgi:DNA-binding CsgD family transcriptional regulator
MPHLPPQFRVTPAFAFVGRSRELDVLRKLMEAAIAEGPRIALVGGEPGSGKSRLVRELAQSMAAGDVLVLYGACDAVVHVPYGPFAAALEQAEGLDANLLRTPAISAPIATGNPDVERHRLHIAVTDLLASVTANQPVLLVLEDCHWADVPTLLLLRHLARSAAVPSMLTVVTSRDTQAEVSSELAETLSDLRRSEGVTRIGLAGLSEEDVAEFVRAAAADVREGVIRDIAAAIAHLTDGNPFLMTELWRSMIDTGALKMAGSRLTLAQPLSELASPGSVREVVGQRLARLAPSTRQLVDAAAVAGPQFHADIARRAANVDEHTLLDALDEAARNGIIEKIPAGGLEYSFTHELARRAIYDRLAALARAELHLRIGTALQASGGAAPGKRLAEVAHHLAAAQPLGDRMRAADHNLRAARWAMAALGFEEAANYFRTALAIGVENAALEAQIQLELGTARHHAGRSTEALDAFSAAAEIARVLGNPELLSHAAIRFESASWRPGLANRQAIELLEEAASAIGEQDSALRVGVLSGLVRALYFRGERERASVVRTNAIEMARRLGDRRGLALLLSGAYWSRDATSLEEVLEMVTEARDIGAELGQPDVQGEACGWRAVTLVTTGDFEAAKTEIAAWLDMPSWNAQPFARHAAEHLGAAIALAEGNLEEAGERAERSREWAGLLTAREPAGIYGIQLFSIRREQGRLEELAPLVRGLADDDGFGPWRPGLAALLTEIGMDDEARRELAKVRARGLDELRDALWLASLTYLTDACAAMSESELAGLVQPELERYAGTNIVVSYGVACYGAADRYLGMLAATLGDWERAKACFEAALELNLRMRAATWVAHTEFEYGRMLLGRGAADDRDRATALLADAAELAERIGMTKLLSRIRSIAPATAMMPPDGLSAREVQILRLIARGLSNRQIGAELIISEHTAANHVRNILRKTSCANRTEAATYAHSHGLATGVPGS